MKISFYYVLEEYINYLKEMEENSRGFTTVPNVRYANNSKFVFGIVLKVNDLDYFVPISSYKKKQEDNLIISIQDHGKKVACGSMRFNYMIPIPPSCLTPVDFKSNAFSGAEKILLQKEYKACKKLLTQAQKRAKKTYERVLAGKDETLLKNSCDFRLLEKACKEYIYKE